MNKINQKIPDLQDFVLVYDNLNRKWRIMKLIWENNNHHWMTDSKLIFGRDDNRFAFWQTLPNEPGTS